MGPVCAATFTLRKMSRPILLVMFAIIATLGGAQTADGVSSRRPRKTPVPLKNLKKDLKASAQALQTQWQVSTPAGETWAGINAWQRFVIVDALAQYTELSGDRSYTAQIERAVVNHAGLDGNDDDLWAVIASLHIYRLHQSPTLLEFSRTKFSELTDKYWDETCGGGMWWDHQRTYKNAITNELLLYAATLLYRATDDPVYSAWAYKEWVWFRGSGMINNDGLVNDGLNSACKNNGSPTYTYNQGVILGGLVNLYTIEGDSSYIATATLIAQAAIRKLSVAGILHEPGPALTQDSETFKGSFVYYLGDLVSFAGDTKVRESLTFFLRDNADCLRRHRRKSGNKLNAYWDGSPVLYGAAAQAAGLELLDATFRVTRMSEKFDFARVGTDR